MIGSKEFDIIKDHVVNEETSAKHCQTLSE